MKIKLSAVCSVLVVLFFAVGLAGFLIPSLISLFLKLVPFHLLLMAILLVWSQQDKNTRFWLFISAVYIAGFLVELLGVHTGTVFGKYFYKETLGLQLLQVPLMIGVNWFILVYSSGIVVNISGIKNDNLKAASGALLLVLLDVLIEPVAIKFNYWEWHGPEIPMQNYIAWYIFSFLMLRLFYGLRFNKTNRVAVVLFITQLLFFIALNIWAI